MCTFISLAGNLIYLSNGTYMAHEALITNIYILCSDETFLFEHLS